ncbi:MAG: M23 family metallopeptidase [Chloroflexi bacterium]|nr:M23 family metallopeptidase [Chloroflexota bacterium]
MIQRLALQVHDLPKLARLVGHLALILFFFLLSKDIQLQELPKPSLNGYSGYSEVPDAFLPDYGHGYAYAFSSVSRASDSRYLERGAVPITLRTLNGIRDALPLHLPQRTVRTSVITYQVQAGDSVLSIAEKFGLDGNSILWANEKLANNPDFLQIGQELNILPVDGAYHTVAKGETLAGIAAKYKVEPEAITSYKGNGLEPPYSLTAGQQLIIPGGVKPYVPKKVEVVSSAPAPQNAKRGTGAFAWPMSGQISQRYWAGHLAIDIAAPKGRAIVSADSGYVSYVQVSNTGYGLMVLIDHGNGFQTRYAHLSAIYVEVGQSVGRGETIGLCGSTGNSTGPHLHFEVIKGGSRLNPLNYLP